ncbi:ATP-binding protein [Microbacterium sp. NPDC087868]|uniref:ATP-binding protein n=1 Tax=Microbacterium sp. NPDC087868 TaxID=3364195 RepID=UPI00384AD73D
MDAETRAVHIDGPARLELVDHVLDALDGLWADAPHVADRDRTLFALAVSEVATNMVQHTDDPDGVTLTVDIRVSSDDLLATLTDTAPPAEIDWDGVDMPDADSESGRGLALSTAALDEFRHYADARGNTWRLQRRLAP